MRRERSELLAVKKRRGRPYNPDAKRHRTTREGRRTGIDPIDPGAELLLAKKRRVTGGRTDLEINAASVLLGHELITREQYDRLGAVTQWLRLAARAWGGANGSVAGLWSGIVASLSRARTTGTVPDGADWARLRLAKALNRLNGSRELVIELAEGRVPPLVVRVLLRAMTASDEEELAALRDGLDLM